MSDVMMFDFLYVNQHFRGGFKKSQFSTIAIYPPALSL